MEDTLPENKIDKEISAVAVEVGLRGDETAAILSARALALAEEPIHEGEAGGLDILRFRLAPETYGIESSFVREVYPLRDFSALPSTPPFVLGITSVRGQVFSIIDLRKFFGLPATDEANPDLVIIVQSGDMQVAILVDAVSDVRTIPPGDIQPALPALTGGCAPYLHGITSDRVTLLDIEKLLSDPKIIVGKEADD